MTQLEVHLEGSPLQAPVDLHYVDDLIYYDGPLLSLQMDRVSYGPVLTYWLDCDDVRNVWADIWLAKGDLALLLDDQVDLLTTLRRATRIVVYETRDTAERLESREVVPADMPEAYCPSPGAHLLPGAEFRAQLKTKIQEVGIRD